MKIKLTTVFVDDQDRALRFYTEVLGFVKKADFTNGPYRWLTVASAEEPEGTELQLALNNDPADKAYQQAKLQQSQPAAMFFTDDLQADYERMKARGARVHRAADGRGVREDRHPAGRVREPGAGDAAEEVVGHPAVTESESRPRAGACLTARCSRSSPAGSRVPPRR